MFNASALFRNYVITQNSWTFKTALTRQTVVREVQDSIPGYRYRSSIFKALICKKGHVALLCLQHFFFEHLFNLYNVHVVRKRNCGFLFLQKIRYKKYSKAMDVKMQKCVPMPGIEPGQPGWKPGILTTRPHRSCMFQRTFISLHISITIKIWYMCGNLNHWVILCQTMLINIK